MRKTIRLLFMALALFGPVAFTGCKTPQSAPMIAYKSADAVITAVDLAMQGWADHVVKERRRIKALPAIDQGSQGADLLRQEGRVHQAYGRYQASMSLAHAAVNASLASGDQLPQAVGDSAAALLALVRELQGNR